MKTMHCSECGAEIIFLYETPSKAYRIEEGTLIRDDNNMTDDPELNPYCSNDMEHNIEPYEKSSEFWTWVDNVNIHFKDRGLYAI